MINLIVYFLICVFNYFLLGEFIFKGLKKYILVANRSFIFLDEFILKIISYALVLPILTTIVYYELLLFPGNSNFFYFSITFSVLFVFFVVSRNWFRRENVLPEKIFTIRNFNLIFFILLVLQVFYLNYKEITENDYLEYGILGNYFFDNKDISYLKERFLRESYFYYVGLHGFTFPLAKVYERIVNSFFFINSDLYFKSISGVYSVLTLLLFYRISTKFLNSKQSILALCIFAFTYGFFIISLRFHIDTFRLFYFSVSFLFLIEASKKFDTPTAIVSGIILGSHSFAHSLGVFVAFFWIFSLLINSIIQKSFSAINYFYLVMFFLLFGGGHYILEVLLGTGWIFQKIDFY
jgi:hypothetical protein